MSARRLSLIAAYEMRSLVKSRAFVLAAGSFLVLSLALALVGLAGARRAGLAGFDRTSASVLSLALLFVPLVGVLIGALGIAGDLEDGSLGSLLSQPVTRAEAYLGKFTGAALALAAAILTGFGVTGMVLAAKSGGNAVGFVALTGLMVALGITALALGTMMSAMLKSRARVIGAAFALWLWLVYASNLGVIGLTVARKLGPKQLFLLSLFNPVEQARVLGTLVLSERLEVLGPVGIFALDELGSAGVAALALGELATVTVLALAGGYLCFRKTVVA